MANRPAYSINNGKVIRKDYDFQWFAGFAPSQKQKSINSLHEAITKADSNVDIDDFIVFHKQFVNA